MGQVRMANLRGPPKELNLRMEALTLDESREEGK